MIFPRRFTYLSVVVATALMMPCVATAEIVFFDDFEDDAAANSPVINTSAAGGGDVADIGGSWSGGTNPATVRGAGDLALARNSNTTNFSAIANWAAPAIFDGAIIAFDFSRNAGSTASGAESLRLQIAEFLNIDLSYPGGSAGDSFANGISLGSDFYLQPGDEGDIAIVLGASSFTITLSDGDGTDPATSPSIAYSGSPTPADFNNLRMTGLGGSGYFLTVDNVTVTAVPEPHSIAIWSILGLCLAGYGYRRRRRNS